MPLFVVALGLCWGLGSALVRAAGHRPTPGIAAHVLHAALAALLGLGVTSCSFFLWLVVVGHASRSYFLVEAAALVGLLMWLRDRPATVPTPVVTKPTRLPRKLVAALVTSAIVVALGFLFHTLRYPYGYDDSTAIWLLHGKFLFAGGDAWREIFAGGMQQGLGYSPHPDYPLLTSGSISRLWTALGADLPLAPAAVNLACLASVVALAASLVTLRRGGAQGLLAGLTVLGTVKYVEHAASQYADVPLSAFLLGSVACLSLSATSAGSRRGYLVLAGALAACAAWTKNEGLLFAGILLVSVVAFRLRQGWRTCLRDGLALVAGLAPILLVVLYFKLQIAGTNDLVAGQDAATTWSRVWEPARWGQIAAAFATSFVSMAKGLAVAMLAYLAIMGVTLPRSQRAEVALLGCIVLGVLVGYFGVYLVTPHDLGWHLETSVRRLWFHVWPSAVLLFFLVARPPEWSESRELAAHAAIDRAGA